MKRKSRIRFLDFFILLVIIGIVASVTLPTYFSNIEKAKAVEAEITLDVVHDVLLNYYHQKKQFPIATSPVPLICLPGVNFDSDELDGKYYHAENYIYISNPAGDSFKIKAIYPQNPVKLSREINESGKIFTQISF